MTEMLGDYWPVIILALVLGAIVGFLLFGRGALGI